MSPYAALGTVLLWVASIAGSFFYGQHVGDVTQQAKQAEVKQAIEDTREQARQGAASEIAKLKTKNTKAQADLREVVRSAPAGLDCQLPPDGLRIINEALTGQSSRPGRDGGGRLPDTVTATEY